jgi:hypothetical protein
MQDMWVVSRFDKQKLESSAWSSLCLDDYLDGFARGMEPVILFEHEEYVRDGDGAMTRQIVD